MNFVIIPDDNQDLFITELIGAFPELKENVLDEFYIGLIHLQVGVFTEFTQKAIDSNNISLALKCFKFVENIMDDVNGSIRDALITSWVLHLIFIRNEKLYNQFPSALKALRSEWEKRIETASKKK